MSLILEVIVKIVLKLFLMKKDKYHALKNMEFSNITLSNKNNIISKKYNIDLLEKLCSQNNIQLVENYKNVKFNAHYFISGKCKNV